MKETGKVFQVGTQQRSTESPMFMEAIAIVQSGRLGKKVNAHVAIGGTPHGKAEPFARRRRRPGSIGISGSGGASTSDFSARAPQGVPLVLRLLGRQDDRLGSRITSTSPNGRLGHDHSGPVKVTAKGKFSPIVPDKFDWLAYFAGKAKLKNGYQTATKFNIELEYADGSTHHTCATSTSREDGKTKHENGILFEGEDGRIFVNREKLTGKPVEEMTKADKEKMHARVVKLYHGKEPTDHMQNFFDCVAEPRHADFGRGNAPSHDDVLAICAISR